MGKGLLTPILRVSTFLCFAAAFCVVPPGAAAQDPAADPNASTITGTITAVHPPDGFEVKGKPVTTDSTTKFGPLGSIPRVVSADFRGQIAVGAYVQVIGSMDWSTHVLTAKIVRVRADVDDKVSGLGVIDRILARGSDIVFRADGYVFRLPAGAEASFKGEVSTIAGVDAGTLVRYEGIRTGFEVVATKMEFFKPKPHPSKSDPAKFVQVTTFPPGSIIDFDGSFSTGGAGKNAQDSPGGACGWYPIPDVPAVQEHVRHLGMSLVPQYQRDLPDDSPEKIPFRFYVVEEKEIRSDLFCYEGLVLVPVSVINRLRNEDQLAAVLADGVAASLERQQARLSSAETTAFLALVPAIGLGGASLIGAPVVKHELARKMEDQRGRVALSLMTEAGYNPWQAPEAWRLLAPSRLPKDPSKLKYPNRAQYLLDILHMQYKRPPE